MKKGKLKSRLISSMICVLLVISLVSGCGSDSSQDNASSSDESSSQDDASSSNESSQDNASSSNEEEVVVSLSFQYQYDVAKEVIESYMEEHPNVKIEYRKLDENDEEMVTKLTGGVFEDVYIIPSILEISELPNYFAPLGDAAEMAEKYYYGDYMNVAGQSYGYPIGVVYEGLLYNQDVLDKYYDGKVPMTLDELYECCGILADNGIIPIYSNAGSSWPLRYWDNLAITMSNDPDYANTIVTTEEPWAEGSYLRQAEDILANIAANGWLEADVVSADQWDTTMTSIAMGETAFIFTGQWAIANIRATTEELGNNGDAIQFTAFPYKNDVSAENPLNLRVAQDLFIGVNKNAKNLDAAIEFAQYFSENIPEYISENGILIEGGEVMDSVAHLQELDYINLYTSPARDPKIAEMAGNCKVDVYAYDSFLLEYIILPTSQSGSADTAKYDELNELWKTNFK